MKIFRLILAAVFVSSAPAWAALKVESYNAKNNKVIFSGDPDEFQNLNPGYRLTLKINDEKSCDLEVLEKREDKLVADSTLCPFKKDIAPGQLAVKAGSGETPDSPPKAAAEETPESPQAPSRSEFAFDLGLVYSSIDKYDTKGTIEPGGTGFDGSFETEPAFGITLGFTFRQAPEKNWFVHGGLLVEFPREIKSQSASASGVSVNASYAGADVKATYVALYGNFNYEVAQSFYLIAGLGYGALALSGFTPEIESTGGIHLQAGVGFHFDRRLYLEIVGRAQTATAERDFGATTGDKVEYDTINAVGAVATLRYAFF